MRRFITSGIIVITLLLMVSANAHSHYIYNWWNDGENGNTTVGQLGLDCGAWDDEVVDKDDLTNFNYKDQFGTEWGIDNIIEFSVEQGETANTLLILGDEKNGVDMVRSGNVTATYWGFTSTEFDEVKGGFLHTGYWIMTREHEDCNPVPEPATLTLLGIGLVGLIGGAARKKLKKKAIAKT